MKSSSQTSEPLSEKSSESSEKSSEKSSESSEKSSEKSSEPSSEKSSESSKKTYEMIHDARYWDSPQFKLVSDFEPRGSQPQAIEKLVAGLKKGEQFQTLLGVTGSGKTYTVANAINQIKKPTLVIAHNKTLAAQLYNEFKDFFPENRVEYFVSYYDYYQPESYLPTKDQYIEKDAQINPKIEQMRLATTASLMSRQDVIVVASVSCIYGLGNPENFQKMGFELKVGDKVQRKEILQKLIEIQFERNDMELMPGRFRVKGDTIDIIPGYFCLLYTSDAA